MIGVDEREVCVWSRIKMLLEAHVEIDFFIEKQTTKYKTKISNENPDA